MTLIDATGTLEAPPCGYVWLSASGTQGVGGTYLLNPDTQIVYSPLDNIPLVCEPLTPFAPWEPDETPPPNQYVPTPPPLGQGGAAIAPPTHAQWSSDPLYAVALAAGALGLPLPPPPPPTSPSGGPNSPGGGAKTIIVAPKDPNELLGPSGFGPQEFVSADQSLPYTIDFANETAATAPAQQVVITEQLDSNLNWQSFRLGDFGFGGQLYCRSPTRPFTRRPSI